MIKLSIFNHLHEIYFKTADSVSIFNNYYKNYEFMIPFIWLLRKNLRKNNMDYICFSRVQTKPPDFFYHRWLVLY